MDTINCYRDPSFKITCNDSHIPSVASLHTGDGQFVVVHLTLDYVRISMPAPVICDSNRINHTWSSGPFLHGTPFTVSYTRNKLTVLGCNVYGDNRPIVPVTDETTHSRCASLCENVNGSQDCNTAIPKGLQQYYIQTVQLNPGNDHIKNPCIRAFLVDHNFSGVHNSRTSREDFSVPVILDWAVRDLPSCEEARQNSSSYACGANTICLDSQNGRDVDECKDSHKCKDATCFNTPGAYYCICPAGRKPETISEGRLGCTPDKRNHFIVLLLSAGIGVSILIIVFLGTSYSLYTRLVRRKKMKMKQRQFERNDGLLLKQKINTNDGRVEKTEEFE
ncbi:hypothetical protein MKW98_029612 [Papaver atlanticum]|uniref:EGF-like domain-containing protein n=1 Tax=Papaver atlanticum TaxID=357466 RepID=A0AAD4T6H2_9MAGN|nr:hypothetical protein MKW98_029612 [Papaver atlanticum]